MHKHDEDVIAWAIEQAELLRARKFSELDIENIADELKSIISSEQIHFTELLATYMQMLLHQKLKTRMYPDGALTKIIGHRRHQVEYELSATPSLKNYLEEFLFIGAWRDAICRIGKELEVTGNEWKIDELDPELCPWKFEQIMEDGFYPS